MSGGGSKPGQRRGGRKKGSLNLATRERAAIAAGTVLEAKTAGRQLAKDVLSDFTDIFKSMAVRYQPLADNANADEAKFEKWARLAVDCAARAAPFQSPTFRAVTVVPPDKAREDDVTVINLKIFDHTGTAVELTSRSAQEANQRLTERTLEPSKTHGE
jgi:hypothetical protein